MKRLFKVVPILLLIVSLFSCNPVKGHVANNNVPTTENGDATTLTQEKTSQVVEVSSNQLASDKQYTYDEINRKYKALKLKYSKNREDYPSDEVFANFRNVKIGNIKVGRYLIRNGMSEEDIHNWYKNVTEQ